MEKTLVIHEPTTAWNQLLIYSRESSNTSFQDFFNKLPGHTRHSCPNSLWQNANFSLLIHICICFHAKLTLSKYYSVRFQERTLTFIVPRDNTHIFCLLFLKNAGIFAWNFVWKKIRKVGTLKRSLNWSIICGVNNLWQIPALEQYSKPLSHSAS